MYINIGRNEIHFLMGAGASYASSDTMPFRVPLGNGLFESIEEHMNEGRISHLPEPIKQIFREDFEKGMDAFFDTKTNPTWLQNVIADYFLRFSIGGSNLYGALIDILESAGSIYSFSTTNYDLLIEQSLAEKGIHPYYGTLVRHSTGGAVSVLKLHGSPNIIPDVDTSTMVMAGCAFPSNESITSYPTKIAKPEEALEFAQRRGSFASSVAMYAKGKNILHGPDVVIMLRDLWKLKLAYQCKVLIIIGLRYIKHDKHIWDVINKIRDLPVLYIGDDDSFREWQSESGREKCVYVGQYFEDSIEDIKEYITVSKKNF